MQIMCDNQETMDKFLADAKANNMTPQQYFDWLLKLRNADDDLELLNGFGPAEGLTGGNA